MADVSRIRKASVLFCSRFDTYKNYTSSKVALLIYRDENIPSVVLLRCSVPTKSRKAAINCQRGGGEVGPRLDRVRPHLNGLGNLVPGTRLDLGRSTQKEQVGGETDPPKISCTFGDLTNAKYHISSYKFSSHCFQSLNSGLYYWKH